MTEVDLDKEREAKQQMRESYRTMLELSAWKDLKRHVDALEARAILDEDNIPMAQLSQSVGTIAYSRGVRQTIKSLLQHIDWVLHGPL